MPKLLGFANCSETSSCMAEVVVRASVPLVALVTVLVVAFDLCALLVAIRVLARAVVTLYFSLFDACHACPVFLASRVWYQCRSLSPSSPLLQQAQGCQHWNFKVGSCCSC